MIAELPLEAGALNETATGPVDPEVDPDLATGAVGAPGTVPAKLTVSV